MKMAKYIKGENRSQLVLFPTKIDDLIGYDNEVRVIDAFVEMLDLQEKGIKRAVPNKKGTNSFDPRDMLKLFLYGYKNKVRSSRKLEKLCETNIEVMWLLKGLKPDFRTISDFRKDNAKVLKEVFKETVIMSEELKLLGEKFSQDGYKLEGVNSKDNNYTLNKTDDRIDRIEEQIEKYMKEMEDIDKKESGENTLTITKEMVEELKRQKEEKIKEKQARKEELEKIRKEMEESGESQKSLIDKDARLMKNNGKYTVGYNVQELTDTKSHIVINYEANNNPADFGSMERVTIEGKETLGRKGIIDNIADQGYKDRKDMAECLKKGIRPQVTLGEDKNYEIEFEYNEKEISEEKRKSSEVRDLKECLEAGVIPDAYKDILSEIEVVEKEEIENVEEIEAKENIDEEDLRKIAVENEVFVKDRIRNKVFCPHGEVLRPKSKKGEKTRYCNKLACKRCKKPCTTSKFKELLMGENQVILSPTGNEKGKELKKKYNPKQKKKTTTKKVVKVKLTPKEEDLKLRMGTSEHVHGTLKRADDASYLLLKGVEKVNGELALSYCAVNLRRLINMLGVEKIMEYFREKMLEKGKQLA